MRRRRRKVVGLLPRLGRAAGRGAVSLFKHPQPVIALAGMVIGGVWLWRAAVHSDAFRVTAVILPADSSLKAPSDLIGQNLWAVDVRVLAAELHRQQPALKRVRVIRVLPNTLKIELAERVPVAQLRTVRAKNVGEWHAVDGEGYVFGEASPMPQERLVMLRGLESPHDARAALTPGRLSTHPRLVTALQVAERLRQAPALAGHQLTTIDVGDPEQLTFLIDEDVEIRCGGAAELPQQLERLRTALQLVTRQKLMVRYIDVRFADPVIGPRT
jgi:cell division septal protein FtsQ